jgi:hypothetical protein
VGSVPGSEEGLERLVTYVGHDDHVVRCERGRGRDEREFVAELTRVLDDADDGPAPAVESQRIADLEPQ